MVLSKYLKRVIVIGLFAAAIITPFYVSTAMFFPYITGKNFLFRIVVEMIFALWLILALSDARARPKSSPVLWAAVATLSALILSTIFGVDPYRSFWSNFERMEGLISHLHLAAYFLVLASVFKTEIEWRRFLYAVSASGAVMAVYGYLQAFGITAISVQSGLRVDGSFGNASYMAVFMLFNVFIAVYLFATEKKNWLKAVFAAMVILGAPVVFLTATRGAILGLVGGFIVLAVLLAVLMKDKAIRTAAISVVLGVIILISGFLLAQNREFVAKNYVLSRFANLTFAERTIQSRFTIWGMSFEGFKERPILGWGLDNYNQIFNKYYQPSLWLQEPWFDRSHNIVFDWLASSGILGLLAYLSMWASALYVLWKKYFLDASREKLVLAAVTSSLLAAYFFHNFFVFDNIISYILFFTILAFVHFQAVSDKEKDTLSPINPFYSAIIVFLLILSLYFLNVKPISANIALLKTLKNISPPRQNIEVVLSDFQKALSYNTFANQEIREQLSAYTNGVVASDLPQDLKIKAVSLATAELEKQTKETPDEVRAYIFLSSMYGNVGRHKDALAVIERALELSPKKQQIFFLLADTYLALGDGQKAYGAVKFAYESDPEFESAVKNFAIVAIINGRVSEAEEALVRKFGTIIVPDQSLVTAYARAGEFSKVRDIWLEFIKTEPQNAQYRVNLAATYMELGRPQEAIKELERAIELNPQFKEAGEYFINEIKAGRNPAKNQ